jgi:hypothetical protein
LFCRKMHALKLYALWTGARRGVQGQDGHPLQFVLGPDQLEPPRL